MGNDTYYDILGVSCTASPQEIKSKYRFLIRHVHPDLDVPAALFRQVQEAYEVLSDPRHRAAYDRLLAGGNGGFNRSGPTVKDSATGTRRSNGGVWRGGPQSRGRKDVARGPRGRRPQRPSTRHRPNQREGSIGLDLPPGEHTTGALAIAGLVLVLGGLALGALGALGWALLLPGCIVLALAVVGWLGGRGRRAYEAYQRAGMVAIDSMSERQFEVLLEHFFACNGYRVARFPGHGRTGVDMLVDDSRGWVVVQVKRWNAVVDHDAVQLAVAARAHYRVERAMLVTSSSYSPQAVFAAQSNRVTLWNRAVIAEQFATWPSHPPGSALRRFTADVRSGSRICLGYSAVLVIAVSALVSHLLRGGDNSRQVS